MDRISLTPRADWRRKVGECGLAWHTADDGQAYWDESAYWRFSESEIDRLEAATGELYDLVQQAVDHVVRQGRLGDFGYGESAARLIEASWRNRGVAPSLYGRFDLAYDGHDIKLLEFNGDTPTSLVEAAVVQWWWLEERFPGLDQFNSIHEKLVAALRRIGAGMGAGRALHLTCFRPHAEDEGTIEYLAACAAEAGLPAIALGLEDIGWRTGDGRARFVDLADADISLLFKLAPWEWLLKDRFGERLAAEALSGRLTVIEPAWKMLAANKLLLASLWELFAGHPLLSPASLSQADAERFGAYVRKPATGREGANITLVERGEAVERTPGGYSQDRFVYQARARLAHTSAGYAVLGSWIVDGVAAGLGVRESAGPITSNTARFLPHLFQPQI